MQQDSYYTASDCNCTETMTPVHLLYVVNLTRNNLHTLNHLRVLLSIKFGAGASDVARQRCKILLCAERGCFESAGVALLRCQQIVRQLQNVHAWPQIANDCDAYSYYLLLD